MNHLLDILILVLLRMSKISDDPIEFQRAESLTVTI